MVILSTDHLVVGLGHIGALSASLRVTASARPSGLGKGAGGQGAGGKWLAEAAEVLTGICCLLSFVIPVP